MYDLPPKQYITTYFTGNLYVAQIFNKKGKTWKPGYIIKTLPSHSQLPITISKDAMQVTKILDIPYYSWDFYKNTKPGASHPFFYKKYYFCSNKDYLSYHNLNYDVYKLVHQELKRRHSHITYINSFYYWLNRYKKFNLTKDNIFDLVCYEEVLK